MEAFRKVDDLVSKPILGSDGAQAWQSFAESEQGNRAQKQKQQQRIGSSSSSAAASGAPQAPLKAQERAMGYQTWQDEQRDEAKRRNDGTGGTKTTGTPTYTHFKQKQPQPHQKKRKNDPRGDLHQEKNEIDNDDHDGDRKITSATDAATDDAATDAAATAKDHEGDHNVDVVDHDGTAIMKRNKSKRNKSKTTQKPIILHDPMHPLEQVSAAMMMIQQQQLQHQSQQRASTTTTTTTSTSTRNHVVGRDDAPNDALPDGWKCTTDPNTGEVYYYQSITGQTSWTKPTNPHTTTTTKKKAKRDGDICDDDHDHKATTAGTTTTTYTNTTTNETTLTLPDGWTTAIDATTGKTYYYHIPTQITQWDPPNSSTTQYLLSTSTCTSTG